MENEEGRREERSHVVEEMPQQERKERIHVEEKRPGRMVKRTGMDMLAGGLQPSDDAHMHRTHDV